MALPDITYMDTFITDGLKNTLSIKNFYDSILTANNSNLEHVMKIPIDDFFLKYKDQLSDSIQIMTLPEKYFYKPKTLSLDIYGTTDLWLSLLRINGMKNITEFHMPTIKFYNPSDLKELINIFFKRENKIL